MLPVVLVLLVASSAFAAPSIEIIARNINEIPPFRYNGGGINGAVIESAFESIDNGIASTYTVISESDLASLANVNNQEAKAIAVGATFATILQLINDIPGQSCAAANLIRASVNGEPTGRALNDYIRALADGLPLIARSVNNPESFRNTVGPGLSGCVGGGSIYPINAAWDLIFERSSPALASALYNQSCSAKRLYNALDRRTNSIGAQITAAALPELRAVLVRNFGPMSQLAIALANGGDVSALAQRAKSALLSN